jgi:hypothetical protein
VRYFVLDFVWRFLTDPVTHACWAGLTGYFIGLAASGRHKWYTVSWIGLVVAAILHGLNDWSLVNGHLLWIVVTLVSGILFLGYAKVGSRGDLAAPRAGPRYRLASGATSRRSSPVRHHGRTADPPPLVGTLAAGPTVETIHQISPASRRHHGPAAVQGLTTVRRAQTIGEHDAVPADQERPGIGVVIAGPGLDNGHGPLDRVVVLDVLEQDHVVG